MVVPVLMGGAVRTGLVAGFFVLVLTNPALAQEAPLIADEVAQPVMAADAAGGIHAAWIEGETGGYTIYYSSATGGPWTTKEVVVEDVYVFDLTVLIRPGGVPCVIWTQLQLFESCRVGEAWSPAEIVAEQSYTATYRPAYAAEGGLEILYLEPTTSIFLMAFSSTARTRPSRFPSSLSIRTGDFTPSGGISQWDGDGCGPTPGT